MLNGIAYATLTHKNMTVLLLCFGWIFDKNRYPDGFAGAVSPNRCTSMDGQMTVNEDDVDVDDGNVMIVWTGFVRNLYTHTHTPNQT